MKSDSATFQPIHPFLGYPLDTDTKAEKALRLFECISASISKRRTMLKNVGLHQIADSYAGFVEDIILISGLMPDRRRLLSMKNSQLSRSESFLINSHRQGIMPKPSKESNSARQYAINALRCRDRAIEAFLKRSFEVAVMEALQAAYWAGRIDERSQVSAASRRRQVPYDEITAAAKAFTIDPKNRNRRPDAKGVYALLPLTIRPKKMPVFLELFTEWKKRQKSIENRKRFRGSLSPNP